MHISGQSCTGESKKREINVDDKQVSDDVVPLESAGRRLFAMKSKVEKTDSKKQNKEM